MELKQNSELKQLYDEMIVKLADEKDHFETSLHQAELDKEEIQNRNIQLEKGLAEEQERLQVFFFSFTIKVSYKIDIHQLAIKAESELRLELETVKKALKTSRDKQQADQKVAQADIKTLKEQVKDLSDNTKVYPHRSSN